MDEQKSKWHLFHHYGKWVVTETAEIARSKDFKTVGDTLLQKRSCIVCGFTQLNRQNSWL